MKNLNWEDIKVKGSQVGQKRTTCPSCSHERKNKKDLCLAVNFDIGSAYCHHCEATGFKESNQLEVKKTYSLPTQEWKQYSIFTDALVKYCEARAISKQTLLKHGITEETNYIPQVQKERNCMVFNYFEKDILVNKKYRDSQKNFTQQKNGKPILYNINSITGHDKIYIVEGEFDVLAMSEAGFNNCVSLPAGANDNDDYWINSQQYLTEVKTFVIATDSDEKGQKIMEKIAHRLGKYRCSFVKWKGKDANEDLINGNLKTSLASETKFPVSGTFTANDLESKLIDLYEQGLPKTIVPRKKCFGRLHEIFSTMQGQLTVITGIPSHGKSTFAEWYLLNLIDEMDLKLSIFSPEHNPLESHLSNMAQKSIGKPFFERKDSNHRITPIELNRFVKWADKRIYQTSGVSGDSVDWDWLLDKFQEQIFSFGIDIFMIDAWNKVLMPKGMSGKEGIDRVITRITAFCQQNNVQIFLVAHPTKMRKKEDGTYEAPTLYDVSGSADFRNQTHNGFTIHRTFESENTSAGTDFINCKTKFSYQGKIGEQYRFEYDIDSARYNMCGYPKCDRDFTKGGEKEPIDYVMELDKPIEANTNFLDKEYDCPF